MIKDSQRAAISTQAAEEKYIKIWTEKYHCKIFGTVDETRDNTGLSGYYIRDGLRKGQIPHIMTGCKYLIHIPKFLSLLDASVTAYADKSDDLEG